MGVKRLLRHLEVAAVAAVVAGGYVGWISGLFRFLAETLR